VSGVLVGLRDACLVVAVATALFVLGMEVALRYGPQALIWAFAGASLALHVAARWLERRGR